MDDQIGYKLRTKSMTMARKAPTEQQVRDTFQTPAYATRLLLPFIPKHVTHIWECAAGEGRISRILREADYTVSQSDLKEMGDIARFNFLEDKLGLELSDRWAIITNPPFSIKDLFIEKCFEYGLPFALLINADYSGWQIDLIQRGCEKIIPNRRIDYLTPFIISNVNNKEEASYNSIDEIPNELLFKYSASQFHSMWLTHGFSIGRTETFVDLPISEKKGDIK